MTRVSVIVPARDAERLIGPLLDALAEQDADHEVIVVDNGSRDGTAEVAERHPSRPQVLRRDRGGGPGAARNEGAAAARAPVLAFTDADCRPAPGWLAAGLRAMERADLVQGAVAVPEGAHLGPFDHVVRVGAEYGLYETANLFVRREAFTAAGGFEDIVETGDGRPFGEDAWLAWRLRRAGARTAFAADAVVHHEVLPGTAREYLAERAREGWFADLAVRIPELRDVFFWRRWFFSRRSAAFDLALLGVLARRPPALLLTLPWLRLVAAESRGRTGVLSRRVALVVAAGDAIRFTSLLRGSARAGRPLL